MAERTAQQIQHDIEQARVSLATTVDQLTYRTNPKRLLEQVRTTLLAKAATPQGKAAIGAAGAVVVFALVRRLRKH